MLRGCYPHDFEGANVYDANTKKFGGPVSFLTNEGISVVTQGLRSAIKNSSIVIQPSASLDIEGGNSENYEGCVTALQKNKSDLILALAAYPVDTDAINQELMVSESAIAIGSIYDMDLQTETSQVLDSFKSFSPALWLVCFVTFFCIFITLKLRNSLGMKKQNHYSLFYSATHVTRLNQMDDRGTVRRIVFVVASIYSLVIVHYFCSFIKTEIVAVKDPPVLRTYQDIIDRGALPAFLKGTSYDSLFKQEESPPYRRHFWEYAKKKFQPEDMYFEMHPLNVLMFGVAILAGRQVIIMDTLTMPFAVAIGCPGTAVDSNEFLKVFKTVSAGQKVATNSWSDKSEQFNRRFMERNSDLHFDRLPSYGFFTAIDPAEKAYTLAIFTSKLTSEPYRSQLKKSMRRALEIGIFLHIQKQVKYFDGFKPMVDFLGGMKKSKMHLVEQCARDEIVKPESEFHPLTLANFKTLFILMGYLIPLLCFVLLVEL